MDLVSTKINASLMQYSEAWRKTTSSCNHLPGDVLLHITNLAGVEKNGWTVPFEPADSLGITVPDELALPPEPRMFPSAAMPTLSDFMCERGTAGTGLWAPGAHRSRDVVSSLLSNSQPALSCMCPCSSISFKTLSSTMQDDSAFAWSSRMISGRHILAMSKPAANQSMLWNIWT